MTRDDREYPSRPIVGVGGVVVVGADAAAGVGAGRPSLVSPFGVVLVRRRFEPLAGAWSLPGGAVEVGETLHAGLAREVAEETGLSVEVGPVIEVFDRITVDADRRVRYHYVLIDYLCRAQGGRLQPGSDVSEAVIADPADLSGFALTTRAAAVIEAGVRLAGGGAAAPREV